MDHTQVDSDTQRLLLRPQFYQLEDLTSGNKPNSSQALGKPSRKRRIAYADIIVIAISLLCLLLAYLTITPSLSIAWRFQYSGQIVVIGFLLSIMNVCMTTIMPYTFLLLEARFGSSRLQNYEAITTGKVLKSHISLIWRLVLIFLTLLPIGLSVAYKQFLHGVGTTIIPPDPNARYAIDFPQISNFAPANDPIYNLIASINPFQAAWDTPYPTSFPAVYGYNTLLLSNTSAAILDVPQLDYIKRMQDSMRVGEAWTVSATVDAYVASYNTSTSTLRQDDAFWNDALNSGLGFHSDYALVDMHLWTNNRGNFVKIGCMSFGQGNSMFFGVYTTTEFSNSKNFQYTYNLSDSDFQEFRATVGLYDVKRVRCNGIWYINSTSVRLDGGNCDNEVQVDQSIVENNGVYGDNFWPYPTDMLPEFSHLYRSAGQISNWPWLDATYAVSVATSYWARAVYRFNNMNISHTGPDTIASYHPISEHIISQRSTLNASGYLYLVLAIQPVLTILAFLISIQLQTVPIGRGFNITALLSGFDASTSQLIAGASLSGDLKKPVRLDIMPQIPEQQISSSDNPPDQDTRIIYRLTPGFKSNDRPQLQKGMVYS